MIKIRYPLFGGRWIRYPLLGADGSAIPIWSGRNVLECNFVDLQRGVGADTVEEPRGGWSSGCGAHCAERLSIAPNCLNPVPPVRSSEQLGADQSIRHWPRDQLLKTSHELGLAVQVDCWLTSVRIRWPMLPLFPAFQAIGPCCRMASRTESIGHQMVF